MASRLPEEMIINILSFLPVKSISRFRCVCKTWYELLKSPDFIQMHLNFSKANDHFNFMLSHGKEMYSIHYDGSPLKDLCDKAIQIHPFYKLDPDAGIVAFCDGLFCLGSYRFFETFICLWNPYTGEYKEIMVPPIEFQHPQTTTGVNQESNSVHRNSYGFGYDCNIKDYKLVRIVNLNAYGSEVKVYALGSNSWRLIGNIPYNISYQETRGILVNGTLHWSACKLPAQLHSIISFHIESERLRKYRFHK